MSWYHQASARDANAESAEAEGHIEIPQEPKLIDSNNSLCEGEDSNLHGSYPTSTSRALGSGTELEGLLAAEARALLIAAASGIPVEPERMRGFARACLELTEIGRLALAVLDGGVFAPKRALELAEVVSAPLRATVLLASKM